MIRSKAVPTLVLMLGLAAICAVSLLQHRSSASHDGERALARIKTEINLLQNVPFHANERTGGNAAAAGKQLRAGKRTITEGLAALRRDSPPAELAAVPALLRQNFSGLDRIYAIGAAGEDYGKEADTIANTANGQREALTRLLDAAGREYDRRASAALWQATVGSALAILLLLGAFGFFYRRSLRARADAEHLLRENHALLGISREEALTDALTGLQNRRALINDLDRELPSRDGHEALLALFDLDGFKQYNDTFGHAAGDALLARLGDRLQSAVAGRATAYRMGGDEFCVLAHVAPEAGEELVMLAAAALSETGEMFEIGCSHGVARLPADAASAAQALILTDQRMYAHKAGRSSASRQSTDVLLTVLSERNPTLHEHLTDVADLARATAEAFGLPEPEVKRIALAAELHDVGKTAVPDSILLKRGPLDADEWAFMRRHTVIGERIVRAAPSLEQTAELVRSSHERFDGGGYPDGLSGEAIPLGASVIAVCDAYDAMVSNRPYRDKMSAEDALAELRSCSGAQFDPKVVETFAAVLEARVPA
jgi:diguanylate cyclase (GGDEF)-like protein